MSIQRLTMRMGNMPEADVAVQTRSEEEPPEFTGAIVFCPICCSNQDADGWGHQEFECDQCGTTFTVAIDPDTVATYSSA